MQRQLFQRVPLLAARSRGAFGPAADQSCGLLNAQQRDDDAPSCSSPSLHAPSCSFRHPVGARRTFLDKLYNYDKVLRPDVWDANENRMSRTFKSHGSVIDGYTEPPPVQNAWNPWANNAEGFEALNQRWTYTWNKARAARWCKTSVWPFSMAIVRERAADIYLKVNTALSGDNVLQNLHSIKDLVTTGCFNQLEAEAKRRKHLKVVWSLDEEKISTDNVEVVNGHVVRAIDSKDNVSKLHFAQWVVKITTKQRFEVRDKSGKVVAGDFNKVLDVVDYWVIERPIHKSWFLPKPGPIDADWRLLARLDIKPPAPQPPQQQEEAKVQ